MMLWIRSEVTATAAKMLPVLGLLGLLVGAAQVVVLVHSTCSRS